MALRPVSELGLVDLTDLAAKPTAAKGGSGRASEPTAAKAGSGRASKPTTAAAGGERTTQPRRSSATKRPPAHTARSKRAGTTAGPPRHREAKPPTSSPRAEVRRAVATKLAVTVTYAVAGTAGVLLGRAAVRR